MPYTKNTWIDEVLAGPERYTIKEDGGAVFKDDMQIVLKTGVSVPGSSLIAAWMNNIESALESLYAGYIKDNSAKLSYVGAAAYSVLPGSATVNGSILVWNSDIARTSLSLTANTLYYVYLYSNGGTPAVEESVTVPVWDSTLNYYKKTGDATRRCIGWVQTNGSSGIRKFINNVYGRTFELIYADGDTITTSGKELVNAGASTGSWTSFSMSTLVPAHATDWYCAPKISFPTIGDDCILGLSPWDLSTATAGDAPFTIRGHGSVAGSRLFTGRAFLPISQSQTYYYKINRIGGTTSVVYIEAHGARIVR